MKDTALEEWVGVEVRGWYPAPAITCEMNGRRVQYEGKITGIGRHAHLGRCLKLVSAGNDPLYVLPTEFTHRKFSGRWTRINKGRPE